MENLYEVLSDNLIRLRKSKNLTQAEFANIIKYSDKSVSKWETGSAVPNLETLISISEFYGVTVDDLIRKPLNTEKYNTVEKIRKTNKTIIALLAILSLWVIAVSIFVLILIKTSGEDVNWIIFVWAVPFSLATGVVFSAIWKPKYLYVLISALIWTLLASFYLQFLLNGRNYYMIFFVGVPLQVIVILSRGLRYDVVEGQAKKQEQLFKMRSKKKKEAEEAKTEEKTI